MCHDKFGNHVGLDTYKSSSLHDRSSYQKVDIEKMEKEGKYSTDFFVEEALRMIDESTEPFFMYKAFHNPHFPFHAPAELRPVISRKKSIDIAKMQNLLVNFFLFIT